MTTPPHTGLSHAESWELLPWFVNGTLDAAQRARIEAHLADCSTCRAESAAQRRICDTLTAGSPVEQIPTASLNKLHHRLDRLPAHVRPESDFAEEVLPPRRSGTPRARSVALAAAAVIAAVVFGVPAARYWQGAAGHPEAARYFTVTAPAERHPRAVIRAVFSDSTTLADLHRMLADAHLRIVDGPTEAGVYSLAMSGAQSTDWSLQRLRSHDTVRFAEVITPGSEGTP